MNRHAIAKPIFPALFAALLCITVLLGVSCQNQYSSTEITEARNQTLEYQDRVGITYLGNFCIAYLDSSGGVQTIEAKSLKKEQLIRNSAIALSAGYESLAVLQNDGTVTSFGSNMHGQCDTEEWRDVISVKTNGWRTVGLLSGGTVVAVGNNEYGSCNVSEWFDVVKVFLTEQSTYGLKSDGTVVAAGDNSSGECEVSGWTDIVDLSGGHGFVLGLKEDGTVVAAGTNSTGQCDISEWTDIVALSASSDHSVGLKSDGTVVAVGYSTDGECEVDDWSGIIDIIAYDRGFGRGTTLGLGLDGSVITVGAGLGFGETFIERPTEGAIAIYAGQGVDCFLQQDGFVRSEIFVGEYLGPLW